MQIIPAIIPTSFTHLRESLALFSGVTNEFQVDVVDGVFAMPASWPYVDGGVSGVAHELTQCALPNTLELDLMAHEPGADIAVYAHAGIKRIIVHAESTTDLDMLLARTRDSGVSVGLALNNDTPLRVVDTHIGAIDFVQCMGIAQIGAQGHPFDERVLSRIRQLHTSYPELIISIDGSVNAETLPHLQEAGAHRFVVGSAIFSAPDPVVAYHTLRELIV